MTDGTAALRAAAPRWSLAGDRQLLNLLQDIHQRIVTKCNETSERLEQMSKGLRDASIDLQNVNNKFLALSNTQFVESRVYEDDADFTAPPVVSKEPPQISELTSELSKLKRSLLVLERYHEPLHILRDSDSDSDSDEADDRLVLKPKDLYADRPLPFIIGTPQWKAKWHAGLVAEDSDSDSSASRAEEVDQYSESDDEPAKAAQDITLQRKISTGSSSLQSETVSVSPIRPSPSDVAAELARRLGGEVKIPERETVYSEPETVVRKLYKPQQPTATIFPDEPPPLEESSDDDIFAELHKTSLKTHSSNVQSDLFDFSRKNNDLERALFGERRQNEPPSTDSKKSLFEDEIEQDIQNTSVPETVVQDDNVKKPVGGISLFGTNKHAESIGAAILKRNRRKSSTSEESNTEEVKEVKEVNTKEVKDVERKEVKKERDIFDDLFAKSEKLNKKDVKNDVVQKQKVVQKDLFSDLFDDIDDIFSSDIVVKAKDSKNVEPLFNDDDDLFAEISNNKEKQTDEKTIVNKPDLFHEVKPKIEKPTITKIDAAKELKNETKGLFDSDSDDGLFSKEKPKDPKEKAKEPVEYKIKDDIFGDDDDDLFNKNKPQVKNLSKPIEKDNALFDSDDELFASNEKETKTQEKEKTILQDKDDNVLATAAKESSKETVKSTIIDNTADLFKSNEKSKALKVVESINNDIFNDGDELFKKTESLKSNDNDEKLFISNKSSINTDEENDFKPEENTEIANVVESVKNHIFDKNDELFTNSKRSTQSKLEQTNENLIISNNESLNKNETYSKYTQNTIDESTNEPINDFYKPYDQTTNILRTTRIASDEENIKIDKNTNDLFHDADDELFKTPITKPKSIDNQKENPETFAAKTVNTDIFSHIIDNVPPIFEKPKESKKSKNVNALFDDDSDDEALFFKKNDIITDEKPDFSPSEERFGIFNDEPPAIDNDFTQRSIKTNEIPEKALKAEDTLDDSEESSISDKIENITPTKDKINNKTSEDVTDNTTKEPKKVGKLKPMNFNINVNTLLPGASPKKKVEDEQTVSYEELHKTDIIEPSIAKSVSFDDPEILDNKVSKERAKIQVKRRPSTRRARKEAVRKSAIDMTDSFDSPEDSVKDVKVKTVYILNDADIFGDIVETKNTETKKHLNIVDSDEELFKKTDAKDEVKENKTSDTKDDVLKNENSQFNEMKHETKSFLDDDDDDNDDLFKSSTSIKPNNKSVTSEDNLFSKIENKSEDKVSERKSVLDSDDDELFKSKTTKEPAKTNYSSDEDLFKPKKGIETLGKVYETKDANVQKKTHNIFDDFPAIPKDVNIEDEIVKPKEIIKEKPVERAVKSILDDSSDEDDLFKSKTKLSVKKDGKSLFGDDLDDGDDLFGQKTVKERKQDVPAPAPQSSKELKATETVFVDPLSLFGDDE